ncbi:MAG: DNA primase [Pseudomonadota bacterium]
MPISDQAIREIRDRADIVQVIGRTVSLKQRGKNHIGLCPFHQEKTPSFNVSPERGSFYCFGCHASGDVFAFVQRTEGKNFPEAVRELASQVGIVLEERAESPEEKAAREKRQRLLEVLQAVQDLYHGALAAPGGQAARTYLAGRDIDTELIERFGIGFGGAGRDLRRLGPLEGIQDDELEEVGVVARSERGDYHRFGERITFPIRDPQGRVVGVGARVFGRFDDGKRAKYINSPEGPLFHKSDLLYGLHEARPKLGRGGTAVLVEGYLDVISLAKIGLPTAVAPCGTALTRNQARLLRRHAAKAVLCFDGDEAGQKAARRALPLLLEQQIETHLAVLPSAEDPDSMARRNAEQLQTLVDKAPLALEHIIAEAAGQAGATVEGRLRAVDTLREPLLAMPESLARDLFIERAAQALAIEIGALRRELSRHGRTDPAPRAVEPPLDSPVVEAEPRPERIHQQERQIVRLFLEWPNLLEEEAAAHLPQMLRSPSVRQFLDESLQQVQVSGSSPALDTLVGLLSHPVLREVAAEVIQGQRVYGEAQAREALEETCDNLWRTRARTETELLMRELRGIESDPAQLTTQMELLQKIRDLNAQLQRGCPWIMKQSDGGQELEQPGH